MFSRRPVTRLSAQMTSWPSDSSCSHRCEPIIPAPPATRTRNTGVPEAVRSRPASHAKRLLSTGREGIVPASVQTLSALEDAAAPHAGREAALDALAFLAPPDSR